MLVNDACSCYAWLYFLQHKSDPADALRKFLANVRADGAPTKVDSVWSDNEGKFIGGEFGEFGKQLHQAGIHKL